MTSTILPIVVLAAALVFTYFFCIRPMRRGECGMAARSDDEASRRRAEEVRSLRREIEELRRARDQADRTAG